MSTLNQTTFIIIYIFFIHINHHTHANLLRQFYQYYHSPKTTKPFYQVVPGRFRSCADVVHDFRGREDALGAAKCQWLADLKRHVHGLCLGEGIRAGQGVSRKRQLKDPFSFLSLDLTYPFPTLFFFIWRS